MLQNEHFLEALKSPQYLIRVIGHGTRMLHRHPSEPLLLSKLIFLYKDRDIRALLLAHPGKASLDLLVLETHQGTDKGLAGTPVPVSSRHQSFNPNIWHRIGSAESVDDDIHTEGNSADNSDDYNDDHFHDTIIVDGEVVSAV